MRQVLVESLISQQLPTKVASSQLTIQQRFPAIQPHIKPPFFTTTLPPLSTQQLLVVLLAVWCPLVAQASSPLVWAPALPSLVCLPLALVVP